MFILVNDLVLRCQMDGPPDGPPLVFINSLGCDLGIWEGILPAFRDRFHILRYDKRGHGLSDTPPGPYTIRDHAQDLSALLAELNITAPILVGISVGGLIAMDYAVQHPGAVRRLVLLDTAPKIGAAETWNDRIRAVSQRGLTGTAEQIIARWFRPTFQSERPADYRGALNMLARTPAEGYTATCAALRDADLRDAIRAIAVPVLALCGAEDAVVTPPQTRAWAACLPDARVDVIENAAHLPPIEQPQAVAAVMDPFISEVLHAR